MRKIYITGVSGTGKTTLVKELQNRGFYALDIDSSGFCQWQHKHTKEKGHRLEGSKEFLELNDWICDGESLKKLLLAQDKEITFALGMPANQDEFLPFFDSVLLLQCSEETFLNRIDIRTENTFGKEKVEREHILNFYKNFEEKLIKNGAVPINAENPVSKVADDILKVILD